MKLTGHNASNDPAHVAISLAVNDFVFLAEVCRPTHFTPQRCASEQRGEMKLQDETLGTISGFGAGILNALAVGPLDVVKARQQVQRQLLTASPHLAHGEQKYTGTLLSLQTIFREEGFKGFYRGLGPTLVGYAPTWAIYFTVYNRGRREYAERYPRAPPALGTMLSAIASGGVSNLISNPIWVIRARLQTQDHVNSRPEFDNALDCARKMYRREGLVSFYKGLAPAMMTLIHVALQFPLYEQLKHWVLVEEQPDVFSVNHAIRLVGCSATSKLVASLMTYPLEVVRTRMQVQRTDLAENGKLHYRSVWGSIHTIIQEEGYRGLYTVES
ncbi:hypothetical protein BASA81_006802 [Batrachochytrium salamandrivorans]|nr:hypothetical protein BASA81_006802 [Batrachochytrium salamandrivorans]